MTRLSAIKQRVEAASKGPWIDDYNVYDESSAGGGGFKRIEDENFALEAREDIPYLLSQLSLRDAAIQEAIEALEQIVQAPAFDCEHIAKRALSRLRAIGEKGAK